MGRFVSEGLDKLVSEYLNVGSSVAFEGIGHFLRFLPVAHQHLGVGVVGGVSFLGDDDG